MNETGWRALYLFSKVAVLEAEGPTTESCDAAAGLYPDPSEWTRRKLVGEALFPTTPPASPDGGELPSDSTLSQRCVLVVDDDSSFFEGPMILRKCAQRVGSRKRKKTLRPVAAGTETKAHAASTSTLPSNFVQVP